MASSVGYRKNVRFSVADLSVGSPHSSLNRSPRSDGSAQGSGSDSRSDQDNRLRSLARANEESRGGLEEEVESLDGLDSWGAQPNLDGIDDKDKDEPPEAPDANAAKTVNGRPSHWTRFSIFRGSAARSFSEEEEEHAADEEKLKHEKRTPFGKKYPMVASFVESNCFEWTWLFCIAFDCIHVGARVDCASPPGCADSQNLYLAMCDHIMVAFFVLEWCLRYACSWHQQVAHVCGVPTMLRIDWFLVWVSGVLVSWVLQPAGVEFKIFGFITVEFLGLLRVFRASRIIASTHAIRSIEVLKEMWLLLVGVGAALSTLIPSLGLMLFTIFVFSCFAVTLIGRQPDIWADDKIKGYIDEGFMTEDQAVWPKKFRTLTDTLFTMTRLMTFDNSGDVMDSIATMQPWAYAFFLSCTALTAYCLLNLITAVITNNAMEITKADAINHANEAMEKKREQMKQLQDLFTSLDDDGSGEVSTQEFEQAFEEPQVRDRLMILGFDEDELKKLFKLLDSDDTGLVDANEFCQGLSKLSGIAQSRDLLTAMKTGDKVEKKLRGCMKILFPAFENLNFVSEKEMQTFLAACEDKKKKQVCTCRRDRRVKLEKLKEYTERVERLEVCLERIRQSMKNLKKVRRQIQERKANVGDVITSMKVANAFRPGTRST